MKYPSRYTGIVFASLISIVSCGGSDAESQGGTDTRGTDTGGTDTGGTDTGSTDTGSTDTGSTDTGSTDTGSTDTGSADTEGSTTSIYNELGFMASNAVGITSPLELDGSSICIVGDGATQANIEQYFNETNQIFELVSSSSVTTLPVEYTVGRCDVVLGSLTTLGELITSTDEPGANLIVPLAHFGTDGTVANGTRQTGIFVDSPVNGLSYNSLSTSGSTNVDGEYFFVEGELITFSIGALALPSISASSQVSPIDLAVGKPHNVATATNIARLLQSLDDDGNPINGITIPTSAVTSATALNFSVSIEDFENNPDVINLVANSGSVTTSLVGVEAALSHMNETLGINYRQGDRDSGQSLASTCVACHGTTTESSGIYGSIAGLPTNYISAILHAYKDPTEQQGPNTAVMRPLAVSLSELDIADLAAYFSSLN